MHWYPFLSYEIKVADTVPENIECTEYLNHPNRELLIDTGYSILHRS
jgi:hypothetical protein